MTLLTFGPFRLDGRALELWRDGRAIAIRPQPCRLLAILASRPGELVTREELTAVLWPGVHVRFDLGLNSCLKQIRAALGDDADRPRWVETLSRRGYRFIGTVHQDDRRAPSSRRRLVVLPAYAGDARDTAAQPFVRALTDEIETRLARAETGVTVVASSALDESLAGKPSLRTLAEAGMDLVLECRVYREGAAVRVAAQLVDAVDRTLVWAAMFDGSLDQPFQAQRAVATGISSALRDVLGAGEEPRRLAG